MKITEQKDKSKEAFRKFVETYNNESNYWIVYNEKYGNYFVYEERQKGEILQIINNRDLKVVNRKFTVENCANSVLKLINEIGPCNSRTLLSVTGAFI